MPKGRLGSDLDEEDDGLDPKLGDGYSDWFIHFCSKYIFILFNNITANISYKLEIKIYNI